MRFLFWLASSKIIWRILDGRTPTKRYSKVENSVSRTCNANVIFKNHPLDLFGIESTEEGIVSLLEKFCGLKITQGDGFPTRICRSCYVKVIKFQEFVKIVLQAKTQQELVIRSKERDTTARPPPFRYLQRGRKKRSKVTATFLFYFHPGYSLSVSFLFFFLEGMDLGAREKRFP